MAKKTVFIKDTSHTGSTTSDFDTHFASYVRESGLETEVEVTRVADIGVYDQGVVLKITPGDILYAHVQDSDIKRIVDETLKKGKSIPELLCKKEAKQLCVVLRNCGVIDPDSIEEYIAAGLLS